MSSEKAAASKSGYNGALIGRDARTGVFVTSPRLPVTFKVSMGEGRTLSVVRRDVMDTALGKTTLSSKK